MPNTTPAGEAVPGNPSAVILTAPVCDASAWRAADFDGDSSWTVQLTQAAISELDAALRQAQRQGKTAQTITLDSFPLPSVAPLLADARHQLEYGRGFLVLRGLPIDRYTDAEAALLYRGIGVHIGSVVAQNAKGDLLGHVFDRGYAEYRGRSDIRGYQTRAELEFHTDVVDIVGLLCLRTAKEGGQSVIVSSTMIHNEMLAREPALLGLLYGNFLFDRRGEEVDGQVPYFVSPIYSCYHGYLSCRPAIIEYIYSAQPKTGIKLSPAQDQALQTFLNHAAREDLQLRMDLRPGDIQLLNNSVILHSRTAYRDHAEEDRKRHLLRLWLNVENGRPVDPDAFPYRNGVPVGRARSAAHNAQ
jgi:Taurine catabolism dioxygenase TauD, TfdA family